jgi:hypothetical protein
MSIYCPKTLVEEDKHYKAAAVMSHTKETPKEQSDEEVIRSRSHEKQKHHGLNLNISSLGGKSTPIHNIHRSKFQTGKQLSRLSHRS